MVMVQGLMVAGLVIVHFKRDSGVAEWQSREDNTEDFDAVTQTLATTTLRVAGNLRVLTPLLDTFFEDLDPKTVRLDDRGLEIYAPSKIKQVPFLRPADGAISIAMDRRASDGAVVSTSFDVHMPQRGAGVFHLALASLPVSTIVSLKLRVGDQSPLR